MCFLGVKRQCWAFVLVAKRQFLRRACCLEMLTDDESGADAPEVYMSRQAVEDMHAQTALRRDFAFTCHPRTSVEMAWNSDTHDALMDNFRNVHEPLDKSYVSVPLWALNTNIPSRGVRIQRVITLVQDGADEVSQIWYLEDMEVAQYSIYCLSLSDAYVS